MEGVKISWTGFLLLISGGLAFFLFGMELMSEALKKAAGHRIRRILSGITKNRWKGFLSGGLVTMAVQSSSATTVMLVGFVQAGLMSFASTLPIILGSNIGATVTTQLIAFKILNYSLFFVAGGFLVRFFSKEDSIKHWADVVIGFGLVFYGMQLMSDAVEPFKYLSSIKDFLADFGNPITGVFAGFLVTAIVQSSNAVIGILIVLAGHGIINLYHAVPIVLGANVGTCVTAMLAGLGAQTEAKRVALVHISFKIAGVIIILPLLKFFLLIVESAGVYFGSDIPRQIANAHSFFNIIIGLLFLPFSNYFSWFIMKYFPEKKNEDEEAVLFLTYLDYTKIISSEIAIYLARKEIARMAGTIKEMLIISAFPFNESLKKSSDRRFPGKNLEQGLILREKEVDFLEDKISSYLFQVARAGVSENDQASIYAMVSIVKDLESIGDLIQRNFVRLLNKKRSLDVDFSPEGREELAIYHGKAIKQINLLKEAFDEKDSSKAAKIMRKERKYLDLELQYRARHLERVIRQREESVETHELHMELMNILNQVIVFTSNIAKTFVSIL